MLCGLKKQLHATTLTPASKKRKPLSCIGNQDDYALYPSSKKTYRSRGNSHNKENLPGALSKLHLISQSSIKANLPLDLQTGSLLDKHFGDSSAVNNNCNDSTAENSSKNVLNSSEQKAYVLDRFLNNSKNISKQSLATTNCSSLPTVDSSNSKMSLQLQLGDQSSIQRGSNQLRIQRDTLATDADSKFDLNSKGHLTVELSSRDNNLNVHVQQAKQLKSSWSTVCNAFVKVQFCPNTRPGTSFETKVVADKNNPVFNENLELNLKPEDAAKRLMISVWHQDTRKNCSEFLGCLSFGLKHLLHKTRHGRVISGTYHVLPESMGHRKHILVEDEEQNYENVHPNAVNRALVTPPTGNHAVPVAHQFTTPGGLTDRTDETLLDGDDVVVKTLKIHYNHGYGFTVRNTKPVTIGRVKQNGAAFSAGLHPGDVVTKVNGKSLEPLKAEDAALMVRYSKDFVVLEVHCPHYKESMKDYFNTYMKPWAQLNQSNPSQMKSSQESLNSIDYASYIHSASQQDQVLASRMSSGNKSNGGSSSGSAKPKSKDIWELYRNSKNQRVSGDGEVNETGFTENTTMFNNTTTELLSNACGLSQNNSENSGIVVSKSHKVIKSQLSSISKWDPSLSVISQTTDHMQYTHSYRNESYVEAVMDRNIESDLDSTTFGGHSTFSLATEPESLGAGHRRVKAKRGYHRHIPYQPNNTMITENTDQSELNNSYETDVDVTIGPEEGIEWSHNNNDTEVSDPSSCGMENRGFISEDEIMNESCMLGSEFYTDCEDSYLPTTPCNKTTTQIIEDRISRPSHLNDSQSDISSTGSIDEYWLICSPQSQENFVEDLVKEECRFIINMERGIKKYLWASRRVLQGDEFRVIFQNIEKLMAISNFIQQQMREELDRSEVVHFRAVLDVYKNKITMLLEAYSTYIDGLTEALSTLDECKLHSLDFQQFLHEVWEHERLLSIDDFLLLPVRHLSAVKAVFEEMVKKCPTDVECVTLLHGLTDIVEKIPEFDDFPHSVVEAPQ